ncbi:hypothetical protein [Alteromonas sp. CYL-A6]|uniref:hypothetical protein n=1 Tax=Alteromonas nitratireducens TaxID=3390813 RepID=UPI0034BF3D6C
MLDIDLLKTFNAISETGSMANGWVDLIGLARPFIIEPALPIKWRQNSLDNINLPRFDQSKSGDVTTSYLVMLYKLSQGNLDHTTLNDTDLLIYQRHQQEKRKTWFKCFFSPISLSKES